MATKRSKSSKSLVIVESPAKAKTLGKILGPGYVIKASMGHVRDLPEKSFGIKIEEDFKPTYRIIKGRTAIVKELREAAKGASEVYLAPDPDREGEAIAWHLAQALDIPEDRAKRITFNEITQRAVTDAFKKPSTLTIDLVNAQQARRLLDRIVGYKLSPLLWKKIGKGLSAGRVQSVAVRIVVEREKEIQAFKAEEYWEVTALLSKKGDNVAFKAELKKIDGKEFSLKNGDETNKLIEALKREQFTISDVTQKERRENPPPPFTTSLLQQKASVELGFSTKKTMRIAQQLYEGVELGPQGSVGMITYMRTDSFRIAEEAIQDCRKAVEQLFGGKYLEESPRRYASKKGAQDAHEAIRPSSPGFTPELVEKYLTDDQYRLYNIIWKRFIATQMKQAFYLDTTALVNAGNALFQAKGREVKFDGFIKLAGENVGKDVQILPPLSGGETLDVKELTPSQHFTQPPPRFTEASLVKALESHGIGRPSTYAPIISTIQDRGYVRQEERKLHATELGVMVTDKLVQHFDDIMNVDFTARMEERLDLIEEAKADWVEVLREFYGVFSQDLDKATEEMVKVKDTAPESGEMCGTCGKPMVVRWNKFGKFLGCSGFPECKSTKSLGDQPPTGEKCEKCGKEMVIKMSRRGRFLACPGYPECKNTRPLTRSAQSIAIPPDFAMKCEECASAMVVRYGRRGPFIACSGYPACKNTKSVPAEWRKKNKPQEQQPAGAEENLN